MNLQPAEKPVRASTLSVHSIFYTIQGEGPFCGRPAVFVRLAGCNLQCPGCDTEYTKGRKVATVSEVLDAVVFHHPIDRGLVVITGGEPFRQAATGDLVEGLMDIGYTVQVETNGTLAPPVAQFSQYIHFDKYATPRAYIVVSPKTGKVHPRTAAAACAYKYVMHADTVADDGLPVLALDHQAFPIVARPPLGFAGPVYLQPMDTKDAKQNAANLAACVASCIKHGYTLQLQVHKLIGVE